MTVDFQERMKQSHPQSLNFEKLQTLQVNLGNMCNQYCEHCHIDAGPTGNKIMRKEVVEKILNFLQAHEGLILDITGGCPELNPNLKVFIEKAQRLTSRLIIRTNLTIFSEKGMEWVPQWYRAHEVTIMASMPCYTADNVDKQRGNGVFKKSIEALKRLNELGYGESMELNLIYNPGGAFLPSPQKKLEEDYKQHLLENYGIKFHNLFTITNVPLGRFKKYLASRGLSEQYIQTLADHFNPEAVERIMCKSLISVNWQGIVYNCDFNQAAGLPIRNPYGKILKIDDMKEAFEKGFDIMTAEHCYCCTAGAGSSCTGILVS